MVEAKVLPCMYSIIREGPEQTFYQTKIKPHPNFPNHTFKLVNLAYYASIMLNANATKIRAYYSQIMLA
jgi:hypothetical protein